MTAAVAVLCGVVGLAIGSFLNVVIWRVPKGESVVRPASRCPSCQTPITPRDNIPVVSWLLLRGRCRHCGAPISARYPLVELATAALFVGMAVCRGANADLPAFLYLAAVGIALAAIDLDERRLPNALTLPSYAVGGVLLAVAAAADGRWHSFAGALLGMAVLFAFYFVLALIYPAGMGFGDVKLAGVLGLYLGWLGAKEWFVGVLAGFFLGGVLGLLLIAVGRAGRKTKIPFGPFMLLGALIGIVAGHPIATAYLGGRGG